MRSEEPGDPTETLVGQKRTEKTEALRRMLDKTGLFKLGG